MGKDLVSESMELIMLWKEPSQNVGGGREYILRKSLFMFML